MRTTAPESKTSTRVTSFDVSRGIAIIGMVCGHVVEGLVKTGHDGPAAYLVANELFHTFRMPLFFFLAGTFLVQTMRRFSTTGWIADKAAYLVYPYAVWALVRGAVELGALRLGVGEELTVTDVLVGLVWDPRAWYLPALFVSFAVVGTVHAVLGHRRWWAVVAGGLILALTLMSRWSWWPPILEVHPFTAYMLAGVLLASATLRAAAVGRRAAGTTAVVAAAVFAAVVVVLLPTGLLDVSMSGPFVLASVPGVVAVLTAGRALDGTRGGLVLQRLGAWSLVVYVVHGIPLSLVRSFLDLGGVDGFTLHVVAGTAVGVAVPAALAALNERKSWLRWLVTLPGYRRPTTRLA